jgi:carboxypeptidase C (cathepsin A)
MSNCSRLLCCLVLAGLWAPVPAAGASCEVDGAIAPVTTRHEVTLGSGTRIPYFATFAEYALCDDEGRPQATISATAYLRADVTQPERRTVVFFFNGGPGASSSPLHFGALGPRLRGNRGKDGGRRMIENPSSLVDAADLVYIDPVGTGFSRPLPDNDASRYWNNAGDAAAALELIRRWLERHGRTASSVIIVGQSYGGYRLARMMEHAADLNLTALVLISPALDNVGTRSDLDYVFDLPTMAAAAWFHHRIERGGYAVEDWFDAAEEFARTAYLAGLFEGAALAPAERHRLATRIAAFIGLPPEFIAEHDLRVDSQTFLETLLRDEERLVGRLDTRVTGPVPEDPPPDRPAAANDPALGLGATNVITAPDITRYLTRELGVETSREYVSLTLDVNFQWDRSDPQSLPGAPGPARHIAAIMREKPELDLVLMAGIYDLAVPLLAPLYAIRHAAIPLDRVTVARFEGGHSPYDGAEGRERMSRLFRTLLMHNSGTP